MVTQLDVDTLTCSRMDECRIPRSVMLRVLQGVGVATKSSMEDLTPVADLISKYQVVRSSRRLCSDITRIQCDESETSEDALTMFEWHEASNDILYDDRSRQIFILVICVAFLRQQSRSREGLPIDSATMETMWKMMFGVLTHQSLDPPLCSAVRSAQGFLSVALCSLIENGNIAELIRLHVWLPDGMRGNRDFPVHSHQPFAQSWILAGEGTDLLYDVEAVDDIDMATHARYIPAWSDGKNLSSTYKTHQTVSVIANTGGLVRATPGRSTTHTRDMTYTVDAAQFHTSIIREDSLHSTLFFFDSQRGFEKDASVLGPVDGVSFAQHRDPAGVTAAALARMVDATRSWEILMEHGKDCARRGDLETASKRFSDALNLCSKNNDLPQSDCLHGLVLAELENVERQRLLLRQSRADTPTRQMPVSVTGT